MLDLMLEKSKKSAVIMASAFVVAALMTSIMASGIVASIDPAVEGSGAAESSLWNPVPGRNAPETGARSKVPGWVCLGLVFVLEIGIFSVFIYSREASHFGSRGIIRWALAGVAYGLLMQGVLLLLLRLDLKGGGEVIKNVMQVVVLGLSYSLVFKVFPPANSGEEPTASQNSEMKR
jgi:hypothetical protein